MTLTNMCAVCKVPAAQKCSGCKNVVYCSREHQKEDWKAGHKKKCKCYEIAIDKVLGRHLKATRDLKKGEIIMREKPFMIGPKISSQAICLGCHRKLVIPTSTNQNYYKCSKCSWPLCSQDCEDSLWHREECHLMSSKKFTSKINFNATEPDKKESAYCVILPLRCLLLKKSNPSESKDLWELEDHLDERLKTPLYTVLGANLITFIKTVLGLIEWSEKEIMRIAAILDTNSFDLRLISQNINVRGLYLRAAMLSHDCIPNARHIFDETSMDIVFFAKTAIKKGEIISISYTQPLKSTLMRRLHLQQAKCFQCTCNRCKDPEELGTFAGSTICRKCKIGKFISTNPLNNEASWKCQICNKKKSCKEILDEYNEIQNEINELDKRNPDAFEQFIYNYRDTLHEHNTHILQIKYALTQLYGNTPGYTLEEISDAALKRKEDLCSELLNIAETFDGGWSLFRANLLIDLQQAIVLRSKRSLSKQTTTTAQSLEILKRALDYLLEAADILGVEKELDPLLKSKISDLQSDIKNIEESLQTTF